MVQSRARHQSPAQHVGGLCIPYHNRCIAQPYPTYPVPNQNKIKPPPHFQLLNCHPAGNKHTKKHSNIFLPTNTVNCIFGGVTNYRGRLLFDLVASHRTSDRHWRWMGQVPPLSQNAAAAGAPVRGQSRDRRPGLCQQTRSIDPRQR